MDETGEIGAFGNHTVSVAGGVLVVSSWADPAWLPGHTKGLLDADGISVVLVGAILVPALEPGLANGDTCSSVLLLH